MFSIVKLNFKNHRINICFKGSILFLCFLILCRVTIALFAIVVTLELTFRLVFAKSITYLIMTSYILSFFRQSLLTFENCSCSYTFNQSVLSTILFLILYILYENRFLSELLTFQFFFLGVKYNTSHQKYSLLLLAVKKFGLPKKIGNL